jgi:NAD(P) transhydrogenase subunit beta
MIGAVTFSGSIIAAGKLQGLINAAPIIFPGSRLSTPARPWSARRRPST